MSRAAPEARVAMSPGRERLRRSFEFDSIRQAVEEAHSAMERAPDSARSPLAVIIGQHEWLVRSIESILASNGFHAVTAVGAEFAVDRLSVTSPDLIVLEADPPEILWRETLAAVRRAPGVRRNTPILAATAEPLSREKRLEALRGGAWEVFSHPLDAETLVLKARLFAMAKVEADEVRDRGLVDPETDLYNVRGVLRRIYEEASEATRHRRPLACLVTAVDQPAAAPAGGEEEGGGVRAIAQALRKAGRSSDVFGRLGPNEFVVIAPGTDAAGARRFAQRLTGGNGNAGAARPTDVELPPLHAGFAAVGDLTTAQIEPVDLFVRAVAALRAAQAVGPEQRVRSYD
jgi:diguanylate cyclase (GGDEF)-like protein